MHRHTDRIFGLTFGLVFALIASVAFFAFKAIVIWPMMLALIFLGLAIAAPAVLLPLNCLWVVVASRLARVNNHLILGAYFCAVIVPAGLIMQLVGGDPMSRKRNVGSYWSPVARHADASTFLDQF